MHTTQYLNGKKYRFFLLLLLLGFVFISVCVWLLIGKINQFTKIVSSFFFFFKEGQKPRAVILYISILISPCVCCAYLLFYIKKTTNKWNVEGGDGPCNECGVWKFKPIRKFSHLEFFFKCHHV